MQTIASVKARREKAKREARQAAIPMPADREITYHFNKPREYYVAVSQWGYAVHYIPAVAIRAAQDKVPFKAKPSVLLVYRGEGDEGDEIEPKGWDARDHAPEWPNGTSDRVRLCGLMDTHALYIQSPRLTYDNPYKEEKNDET